MIDDNLIPRLQAALRDFQGDEIWLRSPGGNARIGNQAGRLIRDNSLPTRIPAGWACFSACNFLFMGGVVRFVDRAACSSSTCSPIPATARRSAPRSRAARRARSA